MSAMNSRFSPRESSEQFYVPVSASIKLLTDRVGNELAIRLDNWSLKIAVNTGESMLKQRNLKIYILYTTTCHVLECHCNDGPSYKYVLHVKVRNGVN